MSILSGVDNIMLLEDSNMILILAMSVITEEVCSHNQYSLPVDLGIEC